VDDRIDKEILDERLAAEELDFVGFRATPFAVFSHEIDGLNCRGWIHGLSIGSVTHEVLLAIVEDRLKGFQSGPYACRENAVALLAVQTAMAFLKARTESRIARGVEGTHEV